MASWSLLDHEQYKESIKLLYACVYKADVILITNEFSHEYLSYWLSMKTKLML